MVLRHIGAGHQDAGLAQQAQLADASGTGTADDEVGQTVSLVHAADEIGDNQVAWLTLHVNQLLYLLLIVTARLPDELHRRRSDAREVAYDALVHGAGSQAAADEQDGGLRRIEPEGCGTFLARQGFVQQVLSHGIAGEQDAVLGEKAFHAFVGHTYLACLSCQRFVGQSGIAVLLLDETGDAQLVGRAQRSRTGIAAHAYCHVGLEIAQNLLHHALAAQVVPEDADVAQPPQRTEQAAHRQPHYLVACSRHTLHLHSSLGTHEENLHVGPYLAQCTSDAYGREDVPPRTATAYYDSQFTHSLIS